jgi:hypothetical protein
VGFGVAREWLGCCFGVADVRGGFGVAREWLGCCFEVADLYGRACASRFGGWAIDVGC